MNFTVVADESLDTRFNFQFRNPSNNWFMYQPNPNIEFLWGSVESTTVATVNLRTKKDGTPDYGENGTKYYYVEISNLAIKEVAQNHVLTIIEKTTGDYVTIQYSAIGYAHSSVYEYEASYEAGTATTEQAKRAWLCKAMYYYQKAAAAYFA